MVNHFAPLPFAYLKGEGKGATTDRTLRRKKQSLAMVKMPDK
jgi:hypothetical protein